MPRERCTKNVVEMFLGLFNLFLTAYAIYLMPPLALL
jgi:hypothetical protein